MIIILFHRNKTVYGTLAGSLSGFDENVENNPNLEAYIPSGCTYLGGEPGKLPDNPPSPGIGTLPIGFFRDEEDQTTGFVPNFTNEYYQGAFLYISTFTYSR